MLLAIFLLIIPDHLFSLILRLYEEVLKSIEITSEKDAHPLGIGVGFIKKVIVGAVKGLESEHIGKLELNGEFTAYRITSYNVCYTKLLRFQFAIKQRRAES